MIINFLFMELELWIGGYLLVPQHKKFFEFGGNCWFNGCKFIR